MNILQEYNVPAKLAQSLSDHWEIVIRLGSKARMACIMLVDHQPHLVLVKDRLSGRFDELHAVVCEAEKNGVPVIMTGVGRNRVRKIASKEISLTRFTDICRLQGLTE